MVCDKGEGDGDGVGCILGVGFAVEVGVGIGLVVGLVKELNSPPMVMYRHCNVSPQSNPPFFLILGNNKVFWFTLEKEFGIVV